MNSILIKRRNWKGRDRTLTAYFPDGSTLVESPDGFAFSDLIADNSTMRLSAIQRVLGIIRFDKEVHHFWFNKHEYTEGDY